MAEKTLDISWETIGKIFLAIFILYIVYLAREIVLWFFFALSISILLQPAINFLRRAYIPKFLAIAMVYLSIFGILGLLLWMTAPIFTFELKQFSQSLPDYFERLNPALKQLGIDVAQSFDEFMQFFTVNLAQSSKSIINALMIFFGGVSSTAFILTLAFFLSLEEDGAERFFKLITPKKYENTIGTLFERAQTSVAGWFGARILSCIFVGVASFIVFYMFGIKYAFLLALISGVLNFIPYIGPWITSGLLVIFIVASTSSWLTVAYVLVSVLVVQEIENKLLTPILMKKIIDLPPVLVLASLLLGAKIFGFLGTIFAVPVFGIIYQFVKEFLEKKREEGQAYE